MVKRLCLEIIKQQQIPPFHRELVKAVTNYGVCEVVLTFTSVDKILCCDHSNEMSLEVLSCGVICVKKIYKMKFGIFV